ncbi:radical SAM family heme chaperone HemW [Verrucomicrobiota bacterium]
MSSASDHIYVHVPFCDGKCAYCSLYSIYYSEKSTEKYLAALSVEFDRTIKDKISPKTIYCGGGTPSVLSPQQLEHLLDIITSRISKKKLKEWTFEAAPNTLTDYKIRLLASAGVNRVSLGVQSFSRSVLEKIGRRHSVNDINTATTALRAGGIMNIGIDLIACLPGTSDKTWRSSLEKAVNLCVPHISVYALTIEKKSEFSVLVRRGIISKPNDEEQLRAMNKAEKLLAAAGYERYEISNYAKLNSGPASSRVMTSKYRCLHNVACWKGEDYFGLGPSAASRCGLKRWTNKPQLKEYIQACLRGTIPPRNRETLNPHADMAERMMFNLRLKEGVNLARFHNVNSEISAYRQNTFKQLIAMGLTEKSGNYYRLTPKGRDFADMVAEALLP